MVDQAWLRTVLASVGGSTDRTERLTGGAVNHTYRVDRADAEPVVLRFAVDPLRTDEFPVEAWAAEQASRIGIPTARPIAHGVEGGVPYALSEYVAPDPRAVHRPWRWLGTYARSVAAIPLRDAPPMLYSRFGTDLAHAWSAHLAYNLDALGPHDPIRRDGAYASPEGVHDLLEPLLTGEFAFGLAHGDLAPRNLVSRGPDRPPVLIDWGAAETGPTPWTDARRVFEWTFVDGSVARADHDDFTAAAGLTSAADLRTLASMTALHLLDVTRWAREHRPDQYDEYVGRCRTGLDRIARTPVERQRRRHPGRAPASPAPRTSASVTRGPTDRARRRGPR
ncbi:aminoglycoside phosphotransferase (APT) family kinase protein [Curtobacterium flaccumfaciens]|uniref:Aminoglycoside phosphotransferase (APT) family kinase protein n=1 Tax=Curtobacterium flaccumfaciens TaxID=2035 RepID=A0A4R6DFW0_9MICO|nr:aminoglycoside phosphotransferase (APT) family kinase protein [Curtobacterium flaccumfaciens]